MTLPGGTRLGPYEVLSPLGAGGMGEVYRARDTRLGRTVAIKILSQALAASPESRQRFEREARTISQLSHPHICALYDVGHDGDVEYLVMEYLEGMTLADRLARGPLPAEETLRYGVEIAEALAKAHRQGVIHRDLKPGNVMLTASGVKLLDFGLARTVAPEASRGGGATSLPTMASRNLTQEGAILGTFQYMAPEQLEGRDADARTDIFALGAVLYEMATGRKAFTGTSQASLITAIMSAEPSPISSVEPLSPPGLDRVVRRCLAKDPERRWESARDVGFELQESGAVPERPLEVVPSRRRLPLGWIAAGVLLALLAGSLLLPRAPRAVLSLPRLQWTIPPPADTSLRGAVALSPDGKSLAFVATRADGNDVLYVRPLDGVEARPLPGTEGANFPFWSPDGRAVAFFARGKLKKADLAGSTPATLCDVSEPRGGTWNARGLILFSANAGGEISRVSENGGESAPLPAFTSVEGSSSRWPVFLPDGEHFLFYRFVGDRTRSGIYVASLDGKDEVRLAESDGGPIYAAPGFLLYRLGSRIVARKFDAGRRRLGGDPFPVIENLRFDGNSTLVTFASASQTGLFACETGGATVSRLVWYDRSGREVDAVRPDGAYGEPAISPDGRRLSVSRGSTENLGGVIWTMDFERRTLAPIDSAARFSATSVWSADGRRIAYAAWPTGEVYVRDAQGAEKEKLLFKSPSFTPLDDWSRDGRYLFYDVIDWKRFHFDVWVRDLAAGANHPLLQAAFMQSGARLSPDGRWLAYESTETGTQEVFLRSFPESTERRQISVDGGNSPRWRGDGKELFFVSPDRKIFSVQVSTAPRLDVGAPRALFQTRILPVVEARNQYDVTPDGQRFLVNSTRPEDAAIPITVLFGWAPGGKL